MVCLNFPPLSYQNCPALPHFHLDLSLLSWRAAVRAIFKFLKAECVGSTERKPEPVSLLYDLFCQHVCGYDLQSSLDLYFTIPVLLSVTFRLTIVKMAQSITPASLPAASFFERNAENNALSEDCLSFYLSVCLCYFLTHLKNILSYFILEMTSKYSERISLRFLACCFVWTETALHHDRKEKHTVHTRMEESHKM